MGLEIIKGRDPIHETGKVLIDRKLWLDAEGNVVEDGDPTAATLLASEGKRLPIAEAKRHGLVGEDGKLIEPKSTPEPAAPAEKAAPKPRTPAKKKPRTPAKKK